MNNLIIINNNDKIKILKIEMTARHYQWCHKNAPLTVMP
jgi:hypothetical protein